MLPKVIRSSISKVRVNQIIGTTILEKQIVHGALCKLWKDDYIDTEDFLDYFLERSFS
uniref:Uncharacterized protein n=1 Tax=Oryza brachyantha TaxID=4533 RepID=J3L1M5_ORYBR